MPDPVVPQASAPLINRSVTWADHNPTHVDIIAHARETRSNTDPVLTVEGIEGRISPAEAYRLAKENGNRAAARAYVRFLFESNPGIAERLVAQHAGQNPIIVPVSAIENQANGPGFNAIPDAFAHELAARTGWSIQGDNGDPPIVQSTRAGRTGAETIERFVRQPYFDGPVERGRNYIVIDDHLTSGGTLRNLTEHIERQGGHVVGAATLVNATRDNSFAPTRPQINRARQTVGGRNFEALHQRIFGVSSENGVLFTSGELRVFGTYETIVRNEGGLNGRALQEATAARFNADLDRAVEAQQQRVAAAAAARRANAGGTGTVTQQGAGNPDLAGRPGSPGSPGGTGQNQAAFPVTVSEDHLRNVPASALSTAPNGNLRITFNTPANATSFADYLQQNRSVTATSSGATVEIPMQQARQLRLLPDNVTPPAQATGTYNLNVLVPGAMPGAPTVITSELPTLSRTTLEFIRTTSQENPNTPIRVTVPGLEGAPSAEMTMRNGVLTASDPATLRRALESNPEALALFRTNEVRAMFDNRTAGIVGGVRFRRPEGNLPLPAPRPQEVTVDRPLLNALNPAFNANAPASDRTTALERGRPVQAIPDNGVLTIGPVEDFQVRDNTTRNERSTAFARDVSTMLRIPPERVVAYVHPRQMTVEQMPGDVRRFVNEALLSRITTEGPNGTRVRMPVAEAARRMRFTIVTHSYGSNFIDEAGVVLQQEMHRLGYSQQEIRSITRQVAVVSMGGVPTINDQTQGLIESPFNQIRVAGTTDYGVQALTEVRDPTGVLRGSQVEIELPREVTVEQRGESRTFTDPHGRMVYMQGINNNQSLSDAVQHAVNAPTLEPETTLAQRARAPAPATPGNGQNTAAPAANRPQTATARAPTNVPRPTVIRPSTAAPSVTPPPQGGTPVPPPSGRPYRAEIASNEIVVDFSEHLTGVLPRDQYISNAFNPYTLPNPNGLPTALIVPTAAEEAQLMREQRAQFNLLSASELNPTNEARLFAEHRTFVEADVNAGNIQQRILEAHNDRLIARSAAFTARNLIALHPNNAALAAFGPGGSREAELQGAVSTQSQVMRDYMQTLRQMPEYQGAAGVARLNRDLTGAYASTNSQSWSNVQLEAAVDDVLDRMQIPRDQHAAIARDILRVTEPMPRADGNGETLSTLDINQQRLNDILTDSRRIRAETFRNRVVDARQTLVERAQYHRAADPYAPAKNEAHARAAFENMYRQLPANGTARQLVDLALSNPDLRIVMIDGPDVSSFLEHRGPGGITGALGFSRGDKNEIYLASESPGQAALVMEEAMHNAIRNIYDNNRSQPFEANVTNDRRFNSDRQALLQEAFRADLERNGRNLDLMRRDLGLQGYNGSEFYAEALVKMEIMEAQGRLTPELARRYSELNRFRTEVLHSDLQATVRGDPLPSMNITEYRTRGGYHSLMLQQSHPFVETVNGVRTIRIPVEILLEGRGGMSGQTSVEQGLRALGINPANGTINGYTLAESEALRARLQQGGDPNARGTTIDIPEEVVRQLNPELHRQLTERSTPLSEVPSSRALAAETLQNRSLTTIELASLQPWRGPDVNAQRAYARVGLTDGMPPPLPSQVEAVGATTPNGYRATVLLDALGMNHATNFRNALEGPGRVEIPMSDAARVRNILEAHKALSQQGVQNLPNVEIVGDRLVITMTQRGANAAEVTANRAQQVATLLQQAPEYMREDNPRINPQAAGALAIVSAMHFQHQAQTQFFNEIQTALNRPEGLPADLMTRLPLSEDPAVQREQRLSRLFAERALEAQTARRESTRLTELAAATPEAQRAELQRQAQGATGTDATRLTEIANGTPEQIRVELQRQATAQSELATRRTNNLEAIRTGANNQYNAAVTQQLGTHAQTQLDLHRAQARGSAALNLIGVYHGIHSLTQTYQNYDRMSGLERAYALTTGGGQIALGATGATVDILTRNNPGSLGGLRFGTGLMAFGTATSAWDLGRAVTGGNQDGYQWARITAASGNLVYNGIGTVGSAMSWRAALQGGTSVAGTRIMTLVGYGAVPIAIASGAATLMHGYADASLEQQRIYSDLYSHVVNHAGMAAGTTTQFADVPGLRPLPTEYNNINTWINEVEQRPESERRYSDNNQVIPFRERMTNNPNDFRRLVAGTSRDYREWGAQIERNEFSGVVTREAVRSSYLGAFVDHAIMRPIAGRNIDQEINTNRENMVAANRIGAIGTHALEELDGLANGQRGYIARYNDYVRIIQPLERDFGRQVTEFNRLREIQSGINSGRNTTLAGVRLEELGMNAYPNGPNTSPTGQEISELSQLQGAARQQREAELQRRYPAYYAAENDPVRRLYNAGRARADAADNARTGQANTLAQRYSDAAVADKPAILGEIREFLGVSQADWTRRDPANNNRSLEDVVRERAGQGQPQLQQLLNHHIQSTSAHRQLVAEMAGRLSIRRERERVEPLLAKEQAVFQQQQATGTALQETYRQMANVQAAPEGPQKTAAQAEFTRARNAAVAQFDELQNRVFAESNAPAADIARARAQNREQFLEALLADQQAVRQGRTLNNAATFLNDYTRRNYNSEASRHFAQNAEFVRRAGIGNRSDLALIGLSRSREEYMAKVMEFAPETLVGQAREENTRYTRDLQTLTQQNRQLNDVMPAVNETARRLGAGDIGDAPLVDQAGRQQFENGRPLTLADVTRQQADVITREQRALTDMRTELAAATDATVRADLTARITLRETVVTRLQLDREATQQQNMQWRIQRLQEVERAYDAQTRRLFDGAIEATGGREPQMDATTRAEIVRLREQVDQSSARVMGLMNPPQGQQPSRPADIQAAQTQAMIANRALAERLYAITRTEPTRAQQGEIETDWRAMEAIRTAQREVLGGNPTAPVAANDNYSAAYRAYMDAQRAAQQSNTPNNQISLTNAQARLLPHHRAYMEQQLTAIVADNNVAATRVSDLAERIRTQETENRNANITVEVSEETRRASTELENFRRDNPNLRRPAEGAPLRDRMTYETLRMRQVRLEWNQMQAQQQDINRARGDHTFPLLSERARTAINQNLTITTAGPIPGEQPIFQDSPRPRGTRIAEGPQAGRFTITMANATEAWNAAFARRDQLENVMRNGVRGFSGEQLARPHYEPPTRDELTRLNNAATALTAANRAFSENPGEATQRAWMEATVRYTQTLNGVTAAREQRRFIATTREQGTELTQQIANWKRELGDLRNKTPAEITRILAERMRSNRDANERNGNNPRFTLDAVAGDAANLSAHPEVARAYQDFLNTIGGPTVLRDAMMQFDADASIPAQLNDMVERGARNIPVPSRAPVTLAARVDNVRALANNATSEADIMIALMEGNMDPDIAAQLATEIGMLQGRLNEIVAGRDAESRRTETPAAPAGTTTTPPANNNTPPAAPPEPTVAAPTPPPVASNTAPAPAPAPAPGVRLATPDRPSGPMDPAMQTALTQYLQGYRGAGDPNANAVLPGRVQSRNNTPTV